MRSKTSEQVSIDEGTGEQSNVTASADLHSVGEELQEASERLREDDPGEAIDYVQDSVDHAKRAAVTAGRRALRSVEESVYRNVMTQVAPQYFDNELISANIQRANQFDDTEAPFFRVDADDETHWVDARSVERYWIHKEL